MLQQHPRVVPLYVSLMAMEWGLFVWGMERRPSQDWNEAPRIDWRQVGKRERRPRGLWPRDRFMGCLDSGRAGVESRVGWAMLLQSRLSYYNEDWKFCCGLAFLSAPHSAKSWSFAVTFRNNLKLLHSRWIALFLQAVLFGTRTVTRESKRA